MFRWVNFFHLLKSRGLGGVKLIVGDKCPGMLEAFSDAKYQRCTVHGAVKSYAQIRLQALAE